jgi:hypothetical protein
MRLIDTAVNLDVRDTSYYVAVTCLGTFSFYDAVTVKRAHGTLTACYLPN